MSAVHHWLLPNLHVFFAALAALLGLLWLPWGWLVRRLLHGSAGPVRLAAALVLVPSGWLMVERPLLGVSRRPVGPVGREPVAGAARRCGWRRANGPLICFESRRSRT